MKQRNWKGTHDRAAPAKGWNKAYTGQKGEESFFVEFALAVQQLATPQWNNHAAIVEGNADLSGLLTIFTAILPVLKRVQQAHQQRRGAEESAAHPINMTVEIDGSVRVRVSSWLFRAKSWLLIAAGTHSCNENPWQQRAARPQGPEMCSCFCPSSRKEQKRVTFLLLPADDLSAQAFS